MGAIFCYPIFNLADTVGSSLGISPSKNNPLSIWIRLEPNPNANLRSERLVELTRTDKNSCIFIFQRRKTETVCWKKLMITFLATVWNENLFIGLNSFRSCQVYTPTVFFWKNYRWYYIRKIQLTKGINTIGWTAMICNIQEWNEHCTAVFVIFDKPWWRSEFCFRTWNET